MYRTFFGIIKSLFEYNTGQEEYERLIEQSDTPDSIDFFGASNFIASNPKMTEIYSPLGVSEMYNLICRLKQNNETLVKDRHLATFQKIHSLDRKQFSVSSSFFEKTSYGYTVMNYYHSPLFDVLFRASPCNITFDKYHEWINVYRGKPSIVFDYKANFDRVVRFLSYVYFDHEWDKAFDKTRTGKRKFTYQDGKSKEIDFIGMHDQIKHKEITLRSGIKVDIVALPYKRESKKCTRFLVYLIPKIHDIDLDGIWEDFRKCTSTDVEDIIDLCTYKKIGFYTPKITKLVTDLSLKTILPPGTLPDTCSAEMKTFFEINEGKNPSVHEKWDYSFYLTRMVIEANKQHLAFVYDYEIQSILLFMKYTGL